MATRPAYVLGSRRNKPGPGELDQPVGQRRLAVINTGNVRKIADILDGTAGGEIAASFGPKPMNSTVLSRDLA